MSLTDEIFFPKFNIYPVPLMTHDLLRRIPDEKYAEIIYHAIIYLQIKRVIELLSNDPEMKYKNGVIQPLQYLKEGSVPSNYLRRYNADDYDTLIEIIENYLKQT